MGRTKMSDESNHLKTTTVEFLLLHANYTPPKVFSVVYCSYN